MATTTNAAIFGRRRGRAPPKLAVRVAEEVRTIGGWPTDTVTIDWVVDESDEDEATRCCQPPAATTTANANATAKAADTTTRTVLLFVPGNPGCVGWYVPMLTEIVRRLGPGFSAAGTSYAGHGVGDDKTTLPRPSPSPSGEEESSSTSMVVDDDAIIDAHSVDGQVDHKAEWVDHVVGSYDDRLLHHHSGNDDDDADAAAPAPPPPKKTRVVFLTHSIGAHLVQRLCVLRPDVLSRASAVVHLMPFIRFAPSHDGHRLPLEAVAHGVPDLAVAFLESVSRLASVLPERWLDVALRESVQDEGGRRLAVGLVRQPAMARNFLRLGIDEIRSLPVARHDDSAMRVIGESCPTAMLYCGRGPVPDQWAPMEHVDDVIEMKRAGVIPRNVTVEYADDLLHDFVVRGPDMVRTVVDFCVRTIEGVTAAVGEEGGGSAVVDGGGAADGGGRPPPRHRSVGRSSPPAAGRLVSRL